MKSRTSKVPLTVWVCIVLGLITFSVYSPALTHEFLTYDDQQYVTENPHVQAGLTWAGVVWAFKSFYASNWHPLTWLSHMLDYQLYGLHPAGHHLTSVLLHTANTMLLFLVLRRMTGALWRSAAVAALFAWHPVHVESVAWIAERKDVLCGFFWLLTMWAYARYAEESEIQTPNTEHQTSNTKARGPASSLNLASRCMFWYVLALVCFTLGLMSKPMVVTLPFVLLLLDYWPLRRFRSTAMSSRSLLSLVLDKVPFFGLSVIGCALTMAAQRQAYSVVSTASLPVGLRLGHALLAWVHYVAAMFVPRHLAVCYPYDRTIPVLEIAGAGVLLGLVTVLALRFAGQRPYLLVGWLWYLGTLVPVIGLVQVGDQAWADRYTYLPLIGLFVAVVWGAGEVAQRAMTRTPTLTQAACGGLATSVGLALMAGTSVQFGFWKNTRTLFEHAVQVTRNNARAITVVGSLLAKEGRLREAKDLYAQALNLTPDDPETHFFLGDALEQEGKLDEAITEYTQALWFRPIQGRTHLALGMVLAKQRKFDAAAAHYRAALAINPESAIAHNNLARVLHTQGRLDEAIDHYSAALALDPRLAQAHNNLGVVLLQRGRLAEGAAQLREAVRLRPEDAEAQYNLALALNQEEQWSEAVELFGRTVTGASTDPDAHYQFATALAHLQKTREAMSHYAGALLLRPDFPDALDGLSWILATASNPEFRNGAEAVRMAERATELTGRRDPGKLRTLAAAYAEAGRFPEAIAASQNASDLASGAGRRGLVEQCQVMLEGFRSSKPWRASR